MEAGQRTIIVSNRLPITSSVTAKGITLHRSSGGLVAGLEGVHGSGNSKWVGCLGEASGHGRTRLEADGERQLEEQGLLDDTLIVFTSDNGPRIGLNGHASAGPWRGYKSHPWEGGHRVPMIVRWPERVRHIDPWGIGRHNSWAVRVAKP